MGEIDDIFSTKKSPAAATSSAPTPSLKSKGKRKAQDDLAVIAQAISDKKKKKKKEKRDGEGAASETNANPVKKSKKSAPQTILDPSAEIEAAPTKSASIPAARKKKGKSAAAAAAATAPPDDLDDFTNSKGSGRARTEEGYAIYSEAELKLGNAGGDTPLCPFDCDCCESAAALRERQSIRAEQVVDHIMQASERDRAGHQSLKSIAVKRATHDMIFR